MKHLKILLFAVLTLFAASACSQNNPQKTMEKKKVLVVFFSATGTTKQVAVNLAKIVDADICEIIPLQPYTSADLDWHNSHSRSSVEMNNSESRPDIKPIELDLKNYDCIFLGYPIWWDLAPRVVSTFIESNDMTGMAVIPFATSGGSSITGSAEALKKTYPDIKWLDGKLLNGESEKALKSWCNKLGISALK